MANWVPLKEVLESPGKYGDISEIPINYTPDYGEITLSGEETGLSIIQKFKTEMNHIWHATMHNGMVYLVSRGVTEQKFRLCGKTGYKNGKQIQRKVADLFGNTMLGATGEIWIEETIDMATKTLPEALRKVKELHWTAIKFQYPYNPGNCIFGLHVVCSGTLYGNDNTSYGHLYNNNGRSYAAEASVRPLVHLPSDILIDTEKIGMGVPLNIWTPDMAKRQGEIEKRIIPVTSYSITEELKQLKAMERWHREKAEEISALIKEIEKN